MSGNLDTFLISLGLMWKGMLGIFAVILVITFFVMFIQWAEKQFTDKSSKKE